MSEIKIESAVLEVLKRSRTEGKLLHLPNDQLDPKFYKRTAKIIELLGGKWNRSQKAHVFDDEAGERVAAAISAECVVDLKKLYQFYPTPATLAQRMVQLAEIGRGNSILEPSAGDGAIVKAIQAAGFRHVDACELDSTRAAKLSENAGVNFIAHDFLTLPMGERYDRIIANPPFRNSQDIHHVNLMIQILAPKGRLVAITSPGWTYRMSAVHVAFRNFMDNGSHYSEALDSGAFSESGAMASAMLIVVNKG